MKKTIKNKVSAMVEKLRSFSEQIEIIIDEENNRLSNMNSRQKALDNKENIITNNEINLDISRVLMNEIIEELSKVIEREA